MDSFWVRKVSNGYIVEQGPQHWVFNSPEEVVTHVARLMDDEPVLSLCNKEKQHVTQQAT